MPVRLCPSKRLLSQLAFAGTLLVACGGGGGEQLRAVVSTLLGLDSPNGGIVGTSLGSVRVRALDVQGTPVRGATIVWVATNGTAQPTSSVTDANGIASTTWTLGTQAAGSQLRAAAVDGVAQAVVFAVPSFAEGPAKISFVVDSTRGGLVAGRTIALLATLYDRFGNGSAAQVRFSSSDSRVAAVDSLGLSGNIGVLHLLSPGTVTIFAVADTAHGQVTLTVAGGALAVGSFPVDTLRPGDALTLDGSGFSTSGMSATVAGVDAAIADVSSSRLVIRVPSAAQLPCGLPSLARVVVRRQLGTATDSVVGAVPLDPAVARRLQPGERVVADSAAAVSCTRLETGGTYVVSLFNTATTVPGGVGVQLRGLPAGPLFATPRPLARTPQSVAVPRAPRPEARVHADYLDRERARLTRLGSPLPAIARARASRGVSPGAGPSSSAAALAVGDVVTLNAMYFDCATPTAIRARVAAVGTRSVVLEDVAAAGSGTRDATYRQLADEFDRVMYPIVTQHFGDPLALDARLGGDGHVRVLFTPYVADSVPNTIGFVTGCNLYAKAQLASSNEAAVFYARLPNAAETVAEWQRNLRSTLIHETKHVAAYAERFARAGSAAPVLEETWLEEATARVAEELYARTFSGATWKGNAAYAPTVGCELTRCDPRPVAMYKHFEALADYESRVDSLTPLGRVSPFDGTFYGSGWLLVRWAADQFATDEPSFFRALTTEVTATGLANLVRRTGRAAPAMLADWSLAMAVDDRPNFVPKTPELAIPSWNTRDVFRGLNAYSPFQFPRPVPLLVRTAAYGDFTIDVPLLRSWTAAYVEVTGAAGTRQLLSVQGRGGALLPAGVGMAIVRVE